MRSSNESCPCGPDRRTHGGSSLTLTETGQGARPRRRHRIDAAGGTPAAEWSIRPLTDGTVPGRTPTWSPDGQQIAFDAEVNGIWALHVVDVATGTTSPVAIAGQNGRFPAWSPDGRHLVYVGGVTRTRLLTFELATRQARAIADLPGPASFPSWSPDGRTIAVTVQRDDELRTWSVRTDGGAAKPLPLAPGRDVWPRFSPNGARLAFFSRRAPHATMTRPTLRTW